MDYTRQTPRTLDSEHRETLALLGRAEQALARDDVGALTAIAGALVRLLEVETGRHFDFEEQRLFPLLDEAGDGDLAALLTEEHQTLRAVAAELLPLVRTLRTGPPAAADAAALKRLLLEFAERQLVHIQKETLALLPMLEDLLDEETDRELLFACTAD